MGRDVSKSKEGSGNEDIPETKPVLIPAIVAPSFLYFISVFMYYSLNSQVLISQVCRHSNYSDCDSSEVSSKASSLSVGIALVSSIPTLLLNGFYGSVADVYGRKYPMISAMVGNGLFALSLLIVVLTNSPFYYVIILAGSLMNGITGGIAVFIMAMFSFTADITRNNPDQRKWVYSLTEVSLFIPNIISPAIGGVLAKAFGFAVPLAVAIGSIVLALLWIIFAVKESLPLDAPSRLQPLRTKVLETFYNISFIFTHKMGGGKAGSSPLPWIASAFFLYFWCFWGEATIEVFFIKHKFHWDSAEIGYFASTQGILYSTSMLIMPSLVNFFLKRETKIVNWIQLGYFCRYIIYDIRNIYHEKLYCCHFRL
jgi:MFS family permease